jgi:signal transduction histidine kinase
VLGLTQQLGGGVRIDSEPRQGTTVSVYLPRAV